MAGRLIGFDLSPRDEKYRHYYRLMKRSKRFREELVGGIIVHNHDIGKTLHLRLRKDGKTIFDDADWYFAPKFGLSGYI